MFTKPLLSKPAKIAAFFTRFLLVSCLPISAVAATLTISDNLILRDVDGKAIEQGFLSSQPSLELMPGKHVLVVKYKDVLEDLDFAEERVVSSDYFVVKFSLKNQKNIILATIAIDDLAAAERFAKAPELTLFDSSKQEIALSLEKLSDYQLAEQVTKVVTTLSLPTAMPSTNDKLGNNTENVTDFNEKVIKNVDTVPMLKYWWQKASPAEKESFLHFINK